MDVRRVVLGDWTPWLRDGLDLVRLSLVAGAVAYGAGGDGRGAAVLGAMAALALLARLIDLPRICDLAFLAALSLQGWGEAGGLYDELAWFDNVSHFLVPALTAPVLYIGLARLDVVPDPRDETHGKHYAGLFIVTFALGAATGAIWEILEWASDRLLHTNLQLGNQDTVTDLVFDSCGALCGAGLLVLWTRYSWGSVRRIPGENRFEDVED